MKLAMVTPFPETPGVITGGVEGVAHCLTQGLLRLGGLDIHIVAPCYRREPGVELRDGLTIHWLKNPKLPGFLAYWTVFRIAVHRKLKEIGPDIAHFQGAAGWTLGYNLPYVLTIHGLYEKDVLYSHGRFRWLRHKFIFNVERRGRKRAKNIISISPYVLGEIGNQITGDVAEIENPVSETFFSVERKNTSQSVLYVGRISERKNIHGLISAFSIVHKHLPMATLRLAGTPESTLYEIRCKALIGELGLEENVHFLGNIDRNKLHDELSSAACLALISFQETAPLVIEEAMAAGVPVLASDVCGIPFLVQDGETGFLVSPKSENEVAKKLIVSLNDNKINMQMGRCAKKVARERFHFNAVAVKTVDFYRMVLNYEALKEYRV